jgi:hypothetical protein
VQEGQALVKQHIFYQGEDLRRGAAASSGAHLGGEALGELRPEPWICGIQAQGGHLHYKLINLDLDLDLNNLPAPQQSPLSPASHPPDAVTALH